MKPADFWNHVDRTGECWIWKSGCQGDGYGNVRIAGKMWLTHRYAYLVSIGAIPNELCVLHKCDNRLCVNPTHLFLGTRVENNHDRDNKGRSRAGDIVQIMKDHPEKRVRGEGVVISKLKECQVTQIRKLGEKGVPHRTIAKQFGVGKTAITDVLRRRTWTHL